MKSSLEQIKETDESNSILEEFKSYFLQYLDLLNSNLEEGLQFFYYLYNNVYPSVEDTSNLYDFYDNTKIYEILFNILQSNQLDEIGYSNTFIIINLLSFLLQKDSKYLEMYLAQDFLEYLAQIILHFNSIELISSSLSIIYKLASFEIESFDLPEPLWNLLLQLLEGGDASHKRDIISIIGYLLPNITDEEILEKLSNLFLETLQNEYIAIKILSLRHLLYISTHFPELRESLISNNLIKIIVSIFPSITSGSSMFFVYTLDLFCLISQEGTNEEIEEIIQTNALSYLIENLLKVDSKIDSNSMDVQKQIFRLVLLLFQREIPELNSLILSLGILQKAVEFLDKGVNSINSIVNPFIFQLLILNDPEITNTIESLGLFPLIFCDIDQYNDEYLSFCLRAIYSIIQMNPKFKAQLEECDIVNELENALQNENSEEIIQSIEQLLSIFDEN